MRAGLLLAFTAYPPSCADRAPSLSGRMGVWGEGSEDSELAGALSPEAQHLTRRWLGPEQNGAFLVSAHPAVPGRPPRSLLVGRGE